MGGTGTEYFYSGEQERGDEDGDRRTARGWGWLEGLGRRVFGEGRKEEASRRGGRR